MYKYIMITPVRNEAKYIRDVIASVMFQNVLPEKWIIIDGGSTDKTRDIIREYTKNHPWIMLTHQTRFSDQGNHANVALAMQEAYAYVKGTNGFEYVWTIDGDQTLSPDVCGGVITEMHIRGVAAASGQVYNKDRSPDTYPDGELPNKRVYQKEALESIGGFPATKYSFDTVILAKLRIAGKAIVTFPEYKIQNLRDDSGIERDTWKSAVQFGKARYYLGYSFPLLVLGCGYLVLQKKPMKSLGVFYGYLASRINMDERIPDTAIINHFGKERVNEVLESLWITPWHIAYFAIVVGVFLIGMFLWRNPF